MAHGAWGLVGVAMMADGTRGRVLIVGGGMAGLGAALACARARPGLAVTLLEQSPLFSEVGAGIQLGPNAVRVLYGWGLRSALASVAVFPQRVRVRAARSGHVLAQLALGERVIERYGAPYATIHRADLHGLLLAAVQQRADVALHTNQMVVGHTEYADRVEVNTRADNRWAGDILLAADGVWSRTRERLLGDGRPSYSGHLAYRGLVRMADLPARLRNPEVTLWLGPAMHGVHYPVRAGEWLNVVVVVEGPLPPSDAESWDHEAHAAHLYTASGPMHGDLEAVLRAVHGWRLWPLHVRAPMRGPHEHAKGRVALLGDAAHPTRPYLAQGAAMALEDAWTLGRLLQHTNASTPDWQACLAHWARMRWARNARVQAQSRRNGIIFHARGPLRWGRDRALAMLGQRLLDQPWLYAGPVDPL